MEWVKVKMLLTLTLCQLICSVSSEDTAPAISISKPDIYELHVVTNIQFRYATTTVSSRVANPANVSQEIGFTVVLPETAFISEFIMVIKGKEYKAYVNEKEKAKKTYDDAVSQGLGAAYVEQKARDSNQFRVSVNIEPLEKVNFILKYEELLSRTLGFYNQVININPGQIVRNFSVVVNINEASNITKVEVPKLQTSNDVTPEAGQNPLATIDWKSSQLVTVTYAPTTKQQEEISKEGINGQLTVKYDVDRGNSQQILVNDGYFVHFYAPDNLEPLPKHVVFVLDYSGSMLGKKIEQLKEAMAIILSDLSSKDSFSLVLFSDIAQTWSPSDNKSETPADYSYYRGENSRPQELGVGHIVPVTPENILAAKNHINTYNDFGSTNIIGGLRDGLRLVDIGSELFKNNAVPPEPMIIFLTDGEPNVELSDPEEIIKRVKELNTKRVAIFSLAFGYGADFKFLRKLSLRNNAFARTIYEGGDATAQLKNFYKEVASPLLSNITFDYLPGQINNETSTRRKFPAFYYGSEIVVAGKLNSEESESNTEDIEVGKLIGRGIDGDQTYPIIIPRPFPLPLPRPNRNYTVGPLEKVWAYLHIQQLLDKIDTSTQESEVAEIKNKALTLALKYQFVTELTSMVVVKPNETKAVDTEQVRPGSPNWQSSVISSPNIAHRSYAISGPSNLQPSSYSGSFYYSKQIPSFQTQDTVDLLLDSEPNVIEEPVIKVAIANLTWLANYTNSDNSTVTLPLDSGDTVFKLGYNEPDNSYGNCQLPGTNTTGECRHLQYCALQTYQDDLSSFLPYRCDIVNGFLGTCCPVPEHTI